MNVLVWANCECAGVGRHMLCFIPFLVDATCFGSFLKNSDVFELLQYFCVYHVTAPGQQRGAPAWNGP